MKQFRPIRLIAISIVLLLHSGVSAQIDPTLSDAFDEVLHNYYETYGMVGISAAVILPNDEIWRGAEGMSTATEALTPDHKFCIGSITKTFISATILKLREEGLIQLTDTVGMWLPEIEYVPGNVTIKQLLNHTSGIFNYTLNPDIWNIANPYMDSIWSPMDVLNTFLLPPNFPAGSDFSYSNSNYLLAGLIIEAATGMEYQEAVRSYILDPLNLTSMFMGVVEDEVDPVAHLWDFNPDIGAVDDLSATFSLNTFFSIAGPAGAMYSQVDEMTIWLKALVTGEVLNEESQTLLLDYIETGIVDPVNGSWNYGLGIQDFDHNGLEMIGHDGDALYVSNGGYLPESGLTIGYSTNDMSVFTPIFVLIEDLLAAYQVWETTVSIHDNGKPTGVHFYPNPASQFVHVQFPTSDGVIELYDLGGRMVYSQKASGTELKIDVSGLAAGFYMLNFTSDKVSFSEKLMVTKNSIF